MSRLAETGGDYLCASAVGDTAVRVFFLGRFKNRTVVWDTTIYTLKRYHQAHTSASVSPQRSFSARPFMEIMGSIDGSLRLKVGLDLPAIDEPTIKKTIIMIRNYKRLKPGRHEWGEEITLTAGT